MTYATDPGTHVPADTTSTLTETIGVLLMTYGSPETLDDVEGYMTNVYGGRVPEADLVTEFKRRYELIGGSPLVQVTKDQAAALEDELRHRHPDGPRFMVEVGMRFFRPFVADGLATLAARGVDRVVAVIMSPQYSPILMSGYHRAIETALAAMERPLPVRIAGSWHQQTLFVQSIAQRVDEALGHIPADVRDGVQVLLTAHSMPLRVIEKEPDYIADLQQTAEAVAARAGLPAERWGFCYQSAGHTPEPWLKPDFADVMPELAAAGKGHVLIAPVQFLADHLEILYDVEVGAREQAEEHGIVFHRTASLNTLPLFIEALADVVEGEAATDGAVAHLIPTPA